MNTLSRDKARLKKQLTFLALANVIVWVLGGAGLMAQSAAPPKTPAGKRRIQVKADYGERAETPQGNISRLTGNVTFFSEDTTLKTDAATYNDKTEIATSPGKLRIDDAQNTLTGNSGVAYYKKRDAVFSGNVTIIARPKPSDGNAPEGSLRREFKDPVNISCDKVIYNWRTRIATATGNLTMKQTNRTVTAEKAVYDGRQEMVVLTGNVRGVNTQGEQIRVDKATFVLREGAERAIFEGKTPFQATFLVDDEDDDAAVPAPNAPNTVPPAAVRPAPAPGESDSPASPDSPNR